MSYSASDFVDTIIDALDVEIPCADEYDELDTSDAADYCLEEIDRLHKDRADKKALLAALEASEKELRLLNLNQGGEQRPNTPAMRVIEQARAAIAQAKGE